MRIPDIEPLSQSIDAERELLIPIIKLARLYGMFGVTFYVLLFQFGDSILMKCKLQRRPNECRPRGFEILDHTVNFIQ
jgi:hypothetical protein